MKWGRKSATWPPIGANSISGKADPTAEMINRIAARINVFFLPRRDANSPPLIPPIMHPINALETVNPLSELEANSGNPCGSMKLILRDSTVPDITAVSYPNNNPPKVAIKVIPNKVLFLFSCFMLDILIDQLFKKFLFSADHEWLTGLSSDLSHVFQSKFSLFKIFSLSGIKRCIALFSPNQIIGIG